MKASLDLDSMKDFATNHVEKFVFGGVLLLLLLFAVRAVGTVSAGAPFTPDELRTEADRAKGNIAKTSWPEYLAAHPEYEGTAYGDTAKRILVPVSLEAYEPPNGMVINRPHFPPRNKRAKPGLIALEGLRANGGNGALQMSGAGGGGMTRGARGMRWVVITGLLPIKEQTDAFNATFEDAMFRDPQRDLPLYLGYWIEKAEVPPSGTAQPPDWKPIALQDAFEVAQYWGSAGTGRRQMVHQKFFPRRPQRGWPLVFPLPPRMNALWGPEVAHPPEIPLLADMSPLERGMMGYGGQYPRGAEAEMDGSEAEEDEEELEGPEGLAPFGPMAGPGMMPGRGPGMMPGGGPGMMPGGGYDEGGPGMGYPGGGMPMTPGGRGGAMPMMPGGGGMYPGAGASAATPTYEDSTQAYGGAGMPYEGPGMGRPGIRSRVEDVVEYHLFRFFDFDVEQGSRYQYRVRLGLFNPNYQVESRFLAKEDFGEQWWVETEWSEPSNVVKVPRDSRLLAGTVKPSREPPGIYTEPSAKVIAVTLDMENGREASEEYMVYRGHLANFEGKIAQQQVPGAYGMPGAGYGMLGEDEGMYPGGMYPGGGYPGYEEEEGPRRRPGTAAREEDEEAPTISHATGMIVLDMVGGDRLHRTDRSLTEPSSLLLVDPDGNLLVQNELDDVGEFSLFHVPEEPKGPRRKKKRPGDMMYPGYEGGGEEMYEGMMGDDMYGEGPTPRRGRRRPRGSYED
jgi:hypothetical protein